MPDKTAAREATAAGYAETLPPPPEPKAPMASGNSVEDRSAEKAAERAHAADTLERTGDFEKRFPSIDAAMLQERADFTAADHYASQGKTRKQMVAEAEEAKQRNAHGSAVTVYPGSGQLDQHAASQAPAHRKYPCGCTAWTNDQFLTVDDLPADCPTHSVPFPSQSAGPEPEPIQPEPMGEAEPPRRDPAQEAE